MRDIEIDGGIRRVRGLSRAEIEIMSDKGYPISRWGIELDSLGIDDKASDMFDEMLKIGCQEADTINFGALTPADERRLFFGIVAETFGAKDEEKNSSRSGAGGQTGIE